MQSENTVALILGGGAGSRLYPLTGQRSKPAVPIAGKYRLIDIPISNCINSNVKRMFVLTQFNSASLNQHIKNTYHFDPFSNGFVDILAAEQTPGNNSWFQGTADAVRQSEHHINHHNYDEILILSGDQLYQMDFAELLKEHRQKNADITIATIPVVAKDATSFGIMKVNKEGMIERFIEKPSEDILEDWKSDVSPKFRRRRSFYLASMGIYVFNKDVMHKLLKDYPDATDFGKEIIPMAIDKGMKVASYSYDGYWTDIGNIPSFFEANLDLTGGLPAFNLFDEENRIFTRPRLLSPSKVFGTRLNKVLFAEGCVSHASRISQSVIGIRSRIGKRSVIEDAIIMGADYYESLEEVLSKSNLHMGIGENCRLKNVIVDKNARIGDDVHIIGDPSLQDTEEEGYCIRGGIIVIKKNAEIASGSRIGLNQ
jgi:glucose-1-phosphate adenylyltransferase